MRKINFKERLDDFWVFPKLTKVEHSGDPDNRFFDFLNEHRDSNTPTNLYVHIPFCDSGCVFCPYYKLHGVSNYNSYLKDYVDGIIYEIKKYANAPYLNKIKIESVHFGGGNPFLIPIEDLRKIVNVIKECFKVEVNDNWTMEGSINCIKTEEYVKGLLELGINRISFGVQTFKESIRKDMNIRATLDDIYNGVKILKKAGLTEYCIDMMYNLPEQSEEDFIRDLELVTELDPYHIDIYNMALFPNTYLDNLVHKEGRYTIKPSNENNMKMFKLGDKWLLDHGYRQIITNTYSRFQEKVHIGDKIYLSNGNVIGVGVSARGYIDGYAYKNVCDIREYLERIRQEKYPKELCCICSEEQNQDRTMVFFPILMEIKREDILNYERYRERIDYIIELGLAKWEGDVLKLTKEGIFWSGNISEIFISDEEWRTYIKSFINSAKEKSNPYNEDFMGKVRVKLED